MNRVATVIRAATVRERTGGASMAALRLAMPPAAVSSACPFCMRMLTDGLADKNKEDIPSLDIAEMLLESVGEDVNA